VHTGIHPSPASLFPVFHPYLLQFAQVNRHFGLYLAMLKLQRNVVNGT
jgi:hypothetical protein